MPINKVSVVWPFIITIVVAAHDNAPSVRVGDPMSMATCSALGGALGWLAGVGSMAIPAFAPITAGGPIMQAFSDAAIGASLGSFSGALCRLGISLFFAHRYEAGIREGQTFIAVLALRRREIRQVRAMFTTERADEISLIGVQARNVLAGSAIVPDVRL